jgi:hypothetical protein
MQVHPRLRDSGSLEGEMLDWAALQTCAVYGERAGNELWARVVVDEPRFDALLTDLGFEWYPDHALEILRTLDTPPLVARRLMFGPCARSAEKRSGKDASTSTARYGDPLVSPSKRTVGFETVNAEWPYRRKL